MTDLLIRKISPKLKDRLKRQARAHGRSLSDEVKVLLDQAMARAEPQKKMGTWMMSLLPDEYRGDDLVFEIPGEMRKPPDFE